MTRKDKWKKIELIAAEFENTEDRYVLPIALKLERWREAVWLTVVRPAFDEFESPLETRWKGPRGKVYYLDDEVDVLIHLIEEGGKRDVRISTCRLVAKLCRQIEEAARKAWIQEGASPHHVEKSLETLNLLKDVFCCNNSRPF